MDGGGGQIEEEQAEPEAPTAPPAGKRRGRRKGSGYRKVDDHLLEEMHRLLTEAICPSITTAAMEVASRSYGHGTPASKAKRLARWYATEYPAD